MSESSDKALRALIEATEKLREDFFQNMRIIESECGLNHDNDRKWYWEEWTKRFDEGQGIIRDNTASNSMADNNANLRAENKCLKAEYDELEELLKEHFRIIEYLESYFRDAALMLKNAPRRSNEEKR